MDSSVLTIAIVGGPSRPRTGDASRRPLYIGCGAASRLGSSMSNSDCASLIGIVLSTPLIDLEAHGLLPQPRPRDPGGPGTIATLLDHALERTPDRVALVG